MRFAWRGTRDALDAGDAIQSLPGRSTAQVAGAVSDKGAPWTLVKQWFAAASVSLETSSIRLKKLSAAAYTVYLIHPWVVVPLTLWPGWQKGAYPRSSASPPDIPASNGSETSERQVPLKWGASKIAPNFIS